MKNHKRLLLFQWKYTKTPMSKFECFGHAVKGQCYYRVEGQGSSGPKLDQNMPIIDIFDIKISDFILKNGISICLLI